ncbi:MAG: S8 family peptidase [Thiolinea sp.]
MLQANQKSIEALSNNPNVELIYEDHATKGNLTTSIPLINGDLAFAQGFSGSGQTIAVIDSGVRSTHEFFSGKIVSEACYSAAGAGTSTCPNGALSSIATGSAEDCSVTISNACGHGTHVAGIAIGKSSQGNGVAKDAKLIAIKTGTLLNGGVTHWSSNLAEALTRVYNLRNQFQIAAVNMSIGDSNQLFTGTCDNANPLVTAAIQQLSSVGIATVISAGNDSRKNAMSFPACISSAISVGNSVSEIQSNSPGYNINDVAWDSNISAETDLFAPGTKILSANQASSTGYTEKWGTSMAAPHVAGAFAILRSKKPSATINEVLDALKNSPVQSVDGRTNGIYSKPRIDIANALSQIQSTSSGNPVPVSPINGVTVSTSTPALTWTAKPGTSEYVLNAWAGPGQNQGPQIIGHIISPASANCAQAGATTCSYTHSTPFPNGQAVWMIRAEYTGPDSALATFNVNAGSSTSLPNACQQGSTPVSFEAIQAGTPLCLAQDGSGQAQLHIYVQSNQVGKTLLIRTAHGSGEGSILFKRSSRPSLSSYDLASNNSGVQDTLSIPNIQLGWNYIHFSSATSFSGVTLLAEYQ